jgi:soluble lytic murein transglycosylase
LDKILVYSLMRQESAFWPDARSRVGALGVMQLMPDTAKASARRMGLPEPSAGRLLEPVHNIQIGVGHLGELVHRYGGNWIYALAAYNAGHHRVVAWQPNEGAVPADVWIANIPFSETREYVQRIIVYTRIYSWRFERDWTMRSAFLGQVLPLTQVVSASE